MGSQGLLPTPSATRPSASTTDAEREHDQGQPPRRCRPSSSRLPRRPGRRGRAVGAASIGAPSIGIETWLLRFSPPGPASPGCFPRTQDVLEVDADPARGPAEIGRRRRAGRGNAPRGALPMRTGKSTTGKTKGTTDTDARGTKSTRREGASGERAGSARRQLDAWLEGRPLDDASLAA